ncbi:MAG: 2-C-methyl-D-erythritol 4-phosphate cytidylyltransferase [Acidimicrobiales bacterium]|nr:2-C-methyl-D-erythritol 4-phosphate cytidylyltransferase [Acidimicrobiales bacterium]
METWAIVVAAGSGTRFGGPKQFALLQGRSVLEWSLATARLACQGVVLVLPPATPGDFAVDAVTIGGATRSESVRSGLAAVPDTADVVAVHDAARPLARVELWNAVIEAVAGGADAAIPATSVTDTVKEVGEAGHLVTLDRSRLVAVQTPQAFRADALKRVHRNGGEASDDAALIEAAGGQVVLVPGPPDNLKVTSPTDLLVAEALIGAERR